MELKKPLSYQDQISRLIENGMRVDDPQNAERILSEVNYYRFTGYALQFRANPKKSIYKPETCFDVVYNICLFDSELRNLLKPYLEKVELLLRTRIAYGFSMVKCRKHPHDGHYQECNFYYKKGFQQIIQSLKREEEYNKDLLLVKHHKAKYEDRMPLWVLVELMSFSSLSKFYSAMYKSEQETIANSLRTKSTVLINHLHCLSILRNKCAHGARLYDAKISPPAKLGKNTLWDFPWLSNDSLVAYIVVLIRRLPNYQDRELLVMQFVDLISKYGDCIDLECLGCAGPYKDLLKQELI